MVVGFWITFFSALLDFNYGYSDVCTAAMIPFISLNYLLLRTAFGEGTHFSMSAA